MDTELLYKTYQPLLYSTAYRMLGSITDAEDIVQDSFLSFSQLHKGEIGNTKAYLLKMITNRCLNLMNSARYKRELYTGPWLPEPEVVSLYQKPLEYIEKNETVNYAFLVLLEQLNPIERAIFIFREALQYDYQEIAEILDKTDTNCRKIFSRAQHKLRQQGPNPPVNNRTAEQLSKKFITASHTGSFQGFVDLLTKEALLFMDGGGKVRTAIFPIIGKHRISAFFQGVYPKGFFEGEYRLVTINGQPGILQIRDYRPVCAICFQTDSIQTHIQHIYMIKNPDKLQHIRIE